MATKAELTNALASSLEDASRLRDQVTRLEAVRKVLADINRGVSRDAKDAQTRLGLWRTFTLDYAKKYLQAEVEQRVLAAQLLAENDGRRDTNGGQV